MHSRRELLSKTIANAQRFERLCFELAAEKKPSKKMKAIETAAHFANGTGAGVYRSSALEFALSELATAIPGHTSSGQNLRSGVLHVMSKAFPWGGHTRVVERWIELDGVRRSQSVVLTEQGNQAIPDLLFEATRNCGGSVSKLRSKGSIPKRARELRSIALGFDFVILHIHMHDVVPSLAFGLPSFPVPVIFYNHADHRFSVGMEVAHAVAETRSWGQELTRLRRGILNSQRLGIPLSTKAITARTDSSTIRQKLSLPDEAKLAFASASQYKFKPFVDLNFFTILKEILRKDRSTWLLLVGVTEEFSRQQLLNVGCNELDLQRVISIPACDETDFRFYLSAANVALDTLPENGCTAVMDYINIGVPVVSRKTFIGQMDYILNQQEYVPTDNEFVERSLSLLDDNQSCVDAAKRQFASLYDDCRNEVFLERLDELYASAGEREPVGFRHDHLFNGFSDLDLFHTDRTTLI